MTGLTKKQLREKLLKLRLDMNPEEVDSLSQKVADNFFKNIDLKDVKSLHTYLTIKKLNEIDTWLIIKKIWRDYPNIKIAVPIMAGDLMSSARLTSSTSLRIGAFGLTEPLRPQLLPEIEQFDVILLPALGYDRQGYRIGYGKGHYDALLAKQKHAKTICLSYRFGFIPKIPHEPHDIPAQMVISETGTQNP